jgi:hypothetical protein
MKAYQLIASAAAAMLTLASISVINYNVAPRHNVAPTHQHTPVTNLAAVQVYPHADELRAAALLATDPAVFVAPDARSMQRDTGTSFQLLDAQVAMPYYSFGNKFGNVSKE